MPTNTATTKREHKHNAGDLKQMQSLPLSAKIRMSQRRIREWYDEFDGMVYIAFSGGKDSTVLKHLVQEVCGLTDVPAVFVDTGLEYPEVRKFATERADVVVRPEMRFDEVIKTYGYPVPTKRVADCVEGARQKGKNRFQLMKETHPRQYDYCMRPVEEKGLGIQQVLEYIGVPYE